MVKIAYEVGLKPEEFWGRPDDISTGMTIREFSEYVDGHKKRFEVQMEQLAWVCSNIMNCWVKRKITPDKLLPKKPRRQGKEAQRNFDSVESAREHLKRARDDAEEKATIKVFDDDEVSLQVDVLDLADFKE